MKTDELLLFLWKNRYLISNCKITINIYWIQKFSIHYNNKDILFYFIFWKYPGQEDCPFISLVFLHSKWGADFKLFKINFLEIFILIFIPFAFYRQYLADPHYSFSFPRLLLEYLSSCLSRTFIWQYKSENIF